MHHLYRVPNQQAAIYGGRMTRIMAIVSQKGGVGKTSLVQNLGAELANQGQLTLLVDSGPAKQSDNGMGVRLG